MLDSFFAFIGQLHKTTLITSRRADQSIANKILTEVTESKTLTVVFLPWHTYQWHIRHMQTKLLEQQSSVLIYDLSPTILDAPIEDILAAYTYVTNKVASDIAALRIDKGYTTVNLVGISLGNVAMCLVAERISEFNKIEMIVPGSNLAKALWHGTRTKRLRQAFQTSGIDKETLVKGLDPLAPINHVSIFRGRAVDVVLSKRDQFMPYRYGKELVEGLEATAARVKVTEKPYGHAMTILRCQPGLNA